jgi:hypothetical protein
MKKAHNFLSKLNGVIKNRISNGAFLYTILSPWLPILVKVFGYMAQTGRGTDLCLKQGFLPMPIHYYSPIPDLVDLAQRQIWMQKSRLPGLDFRIEEQVRFLGSLGAQYGNECQWPAAPTGNSREFYTENNSFSFGCAASLYSILRYYRPRKVFEIGSGNSSLIFSQALQRNLTDGYPCEYTVIDPYPGPLVKDGLPSLTNIISERVELIDISLFESLQENDLLFIDSGHTVRTGGDVNFLFLEVLPRIAPGVIVHIHDINLPYEYPEVYFVNPSFRMFWTEAYLLQAFLAFNAQFEILLAMNYLMTDRQNEFCKAFSHYDPRVNKAVSGSFWIRRKK